LSKEWCRLLLVDIVLGSKTSSEKCVFWFFFVRLPFFPLLGLVAVFFDCSRTFYQLRCGRVFTSSMACIKSWQNSSKINLLMFCCLQLLLFFTLAHHYPNDFFGD